MNKYAAAFKAAFPVTLPICAAFLFLGASYGFLMASKGFSAWYPFFMSALIYAGSMEFVTINLLLGAFDPLYAFFMALMVNSRHLFYGISMLEKFKNISFIKKFYLIFGMCDESFSINCSVEPPKNIDKTWFMIAVTALNQFYWVTGATLGGLIGSYITFSTKGLDFVLTALFAAIFVSQWQNMDNHKPALTGLLVTAACLAVFGTGRFIPPAMVIIVTVFIYVYYKGGGSHELN